MCVVCEMIVQYIEAMVDDKTSVEKIEKLMKKVCNFLPTTMRKQVTVLVIADCYVIFVV